MSRILIIALEQNTRALLMAELQERGHQVATTAELGATIPFLARRKTTFDAIVLDTQGQGVNDVNLVALRRSAGTTPILICTGAADSRRNDYASLGIDRVLVRPLFIGEIAEAVGELVSS